MKHFNDKNILGNTRAPQASSPPQKKLPKKIGYGVEFKTGKDLKNRKTNIFISSGRWTEMPDDGLIDQQSIQLTFGELIDPLEMSPYTEKNERISASDVLKSNEVIKGKTIDYEEETNKDGRITIFDMRARGYVSNEEIPIKTRGIKAENETISGYSVGYSYNPFLDGGASSLGITREGYYGISEEVKNQFADVVQLNSFGFRIDTEDYNENYQGGAHGSILYSSKFETDSIAYYGLLK